MKKTFGSPLVVVTEGQCGNYSNGYSSPKEAKSKAPKVK